MLRDHERNLVQYKVQGLLTLEYLKVVSEVRFALFVVSELLHEQSNDGAKKVDYLHNHAAQALTDIAMQYCTNDRMIDKESGPAMYLVKLLVRQHGLSFITGLAANRDKEWVVPLHLRKSEEV